MPLSFNIDLKMNLGELYLTRSIALTMVERLCLGTKHIASTILRALLMLSATIDKQSFAFDSGQKKSRLKSLILNLKSGRSCTYIWACCTLRSLHAAWNTQSMEKTVKNTRNYTLIKKCNSTL